MKHLLIFLIGYIPSGYLVAQSTSYIDSIVADILLNRIDVYDSELTMIEYNEFGLVTPMVSFNCLWSRPRFMDNIYEETHDGINFDFSWNLDTITYAQDENYLEFRSMLFDDNGSFLRDTTIFIVRKSASKTRDFPFSMESFYSLKNTTWVNERIFFDGEKIELDSCHREYKLQFREDFTFFQNYGNQESSCVTKGMNEEVAIGVEGDAEVFLNFYNKVQGHYLSTVSGVWLIHSNVLNLINLQTRKVIKFKVESYDGEKLLLKTMDSIYLIELKKASP